MDSSSKGLLETGKNVYRLSVSFSHSCHLVGKVVLRVHALDITHLIVCKSQFFSQTSKMLS